MGWISCKAGSYLDSTKGCVPCAIGQFSGDGAVKCSKCPKNEYSDKAGSAKCEKCPIGKETKAEGSKSCTWIACAPGQELNKEIGCVTCAARKYSTDGKKCVSCPDGKYSKEGSTRKEACSCYWSGWKFPNQMDPFVTDNLEDCAKACTKASECVAFNFVEDAKKCSFVMKNEERVEEKGTKVKSTTIDCLKGHPKHKTMLE